MKQFILLFQMEIKACLAQPSILFWGVMYIILVATTSPFLLGIGIVKNSLAIPTILLFAAMLSMLFVTQALIEQAKNDGRYVISVLSGYSPELLVLLRVWSGWFVFIGPSLLLLPIVAVLHNWSLEFFIAFVQVYAICLLFVSLYTHFCGLLFIQLQASSLLIAFVIMPLLAPILIAAGIYLAEQRQSALFLMLGITIVSFALIFIFSNFATLKSAAR